MTIAGGKSLRELRLRANPAYELVLFDRLSPSEQQALEALRSDPDGYGILRPRNDPRLSMKSVSKDTALLLLTLQTAAPLPSYVMNELGDRCDSVIGQMVLDGILEIESNGEMLSAPAAQKLFFGGRDAPESSARLATLSRRALEYAQTLGIVDTAVLSERLYAYNRVPASTRWRRLLSDGSAAELHLGIRDAKIARTLAGAWTRLPPQANGAWIAWQARRASSYGDAATTYKLYVSPACTQLRAAFAATVDAASRSSAFHWKIGKDVCGLLRPDKIVVYFREFSDLQATAAYLLEKLEGCPAQGVPFTAEIGSAGLLSWGIDPPTEDHAVPWLKRESWRARICNRLAAALVLAKTSAGSETSPSRFAMERMRLEGIDPDTWTATNA